MADEHENGHSFVEEEIEEDIGEVSVPEESLPVGTLIRALYDYIPQDFSPNDDIEDELAFKCQDVMKILELMDEDGFYLVR
jgi:hypothetical protein